MTTQYVRVLCDIICKPITPEPRYRVFVNDELFTERTWIWEGVYLEESLQIEAEPGIYPIRVELVDPESATLKVKNMCVDPESNPSASIRKGGILEVIYEG